MSCRIGFYRSASSANVRVSSGRGRRFAGLVRPWHTMERPGKEHSPHAQGRANSACLLHAVVGMPSSVPVQSITPGARCGSYHRSHAASRLHARLAIRLFDALPTKSSLPSEDSLHLALRTGPLPTTTFRAVVSGDPGVRRRQEPIRHPLSVPDLVQLILGSPTCA